MIFHVERLVRGAIKYRLQDSTLVPGDFPLAGLPAAASMEQAIFPRFSIPSQSAFQQQGDKRTAYHTQAQLKLLGFGQMASRLHFLSRSSESQSPAGQTSEQCKFQGQRKFIYFEADAQRRSLLHPPAFRPQTRLWTPSAELCRLPR